MKEEMIAVISVLAIIAFLVIFAIVLIGAFVAYAVTGTIILTLILAGADYLAKKGKMDLKHMNLIAIIILFVGIVLRVAWTYQVIPATGILGDLIFWITGFMILGPVAWIMIMLFYMTGAINPCSGVGS